MDLTRRIDKGKKMGGTKNRKKCHLLTRQKYIEYKTNISREKRFYTRETNTA